MQVVWFKRDLRIHDHLALSLAAEQGPVLPLYILEPALWQQADVSWRQFVFLRDCLRELYVELRQRGQHLVIKVGDAVTVLEQLHQRHEITALWSHQETWNGWTYERDKQLVSWTRSQRIPWYEPSQNGVIRRLNDRNGWASQWYKKMNLPLSTPPLRLHRVDEPSDTLPTPDELGLVEEPTDQFQRGGRSEGLSLLTSFLYDRGEGYTKEMSSPVTAFDSCSRLSAHLAFGTLSMAEVYQAVEQRKKEISSLPVGMKGKWSGALRSFSGRLRWHCHFIQKIEDEPRLEFENLHSAYNGLRENEFNDDFFQAWKTGMTGYPLIDACMRALIATGWINFRMRAMLVSFASYHLWLHWREPALYLARLFVDYEPGIHYSQIQMQSGTTGINSIRIYNPIKQSLDQDPHGNFIRTWVPELRDMPEQHIHTPWTLPSAMNGYPMPIVDEKTARQSAAAKLYAIKKQVSGLQETHDIVIKHASRKPMVKKKTKPKKAKKTDQSIQGELPF